MNTHREQPSAAGEGRAAERGRAPDARSREWLGERLLQSAFGPAVFVLSVVCAVAFWSRVEGRDDSYGGGEWTAPALPDTAGIEGWAAAIEVPPSAGRPGAKLHVRLSPLHADPARQRFDADALERHLGLGPGEPWRLVLTCGGEAPSTDPWSLSLAGWRVVDANGSILRPIVDGPIEPAAGAVSDPLRCLLAPPASIAPGQGVTVVLWGERPGPEPELELPFCDRRWRLAVRRLDGLGYQPALARLDRRAQRGGARERAGKPEGPR